MTYQYSAPPPPTVAPHNGFGITALVLGIVGVVFGFVPLTGFIALICGLVGLVFAGLGLSRIYKRIADNKVVTWFGMGLSALAVLLGIVGLVILNNVAKQLDRGLQEISEGRTVGAPEQTAPTQNLGEPLLISGGLGGETTAKVVASDLRVTDAYTANYGLTTTPANGYFVTFHIAITNSGDAGFSFNPFNYKVIVDGQQYQQANGKSLVVGSAADALSAGVLAPGTSTGGDITFDLPSPHGTLVYAPNYDGVPLGSWSF